MFIIFFLQLVFDRHKDYRNPECTVKVLLNASSVFQPVRVRFVENFVNILKATEFVSENLITLLNFVISNTVLTFTHYFGYSSERKHRNVCSALCVRAEQNWNVSLGPQTYKSTNLCPVIVYYRL